MHKIFLSTLVRQAPRICCRLGGGGGGGVHGVRSKWRLFLSRCTWIAFASLIMWRKRREESVTAVEIWFPGKFCLFCFGHNKRQVILTSFKKSQLQKELLTTVWTIAKPSAGERLGPRNPCKWADIRREKKQAESSWKQFQIKELNLWLCLINGLLVQGPSSHDGSHCPCLLIQVAWGNLSLA